MAFLFLKAKVPECEPPGVSIPGNDLDQKLRIISSFSAPRTTSFHIMLGGTMPAAAKIHIYICSRHICSFLFFPQASCGSCPTPHYPYVANFSHP